MSDLGVFIGIIASSCALIIGAIQKSKCSEIEVCPPKCVRDPTIKNNPPPTPTNSKGIPIGNTQ